MKHAWIKTTLALTIGTVAGHSLANGIAINEQSVSGMGTAFAGRSSSAQDASTVFGNPAGLAKLKRREVSGGMAVVDASVDIHDAQGPADSSNKGDMVPFAAVPFGYFATPLNDDWHFGFGLYVPFGVISDYEKSFQGRYKGLYSKVQVVTLQPTLSYKVNERVSVGFGPTFNTIDGKLTNNLATKGLLGAERDTKLSIKGNDTALGYNLGVLVDLTPSTAWGLTYHSKVDYSLEGHTQVSNAPAGLNLNGNYDAGLDISLPESVDTSLTHQLDEHWTLYGGATWTRWSRLEQILVENQGVPALGQSLGFGTLTEQLQWEDTWSYALGAAYQLNPQWVLRAGLALDAAPTTNAQRSVRIPVGNRKVVSLGAGWSPNPDLTVDIAYSYLRENEAPIDQHESDFQPAYSAKFENSAHGLGTQITYRF
ncbi:MAG: outer membrane protein transport protein [Pseudomonas sp.]|uniref:outer membrane protein transport protein n=1 Tax=Pseudomonas sp. TaxID=306 RepID=UPI003392C321